MDNREYIIAQCLKRMGFTHTTTRGSDDLDFVSISVATARAELELAFDRGFEEGIQPENAPQHD